MKTIFKHSYKTIGDHCTVIFTEIVIILDVKLIKQICFKIGMYTLHTLLNRQCKFHKDWTSSLATPAV